MLPASAYESVHARAGILAAPHHLAAAAGRDVLAEGGNAIEAAVAAGAVIAVVYPHMNHFGGDGFLLLRTPAGKVRYLDGSGPAGARARIELYRAFDLEAIPTRGPLAALTVPGLVGLWALALEAARAFGGRMTLRRLLEPALRHAADGVPVSASQARLAEDKRAELEKVPGFAAAFLQDGKVPPAGALQRQPRLADTLDHLSGAGLDDFYRGDVAREIAADLERIGSPVVRDDLERFRPVERPPLMLKTQAGTLYNAPPPTQGLASLLILGLFERLGPRWPDKATAESFAYVHGLVEATKQAFLIRDTVVTDPDRVTHDLAAILSPAGLDQAAAKIDVRRALPWPQPAGAGDTVWLGAADASGLAVSLIQSVFFEFGSGCVLPGTGILMQNRGASFSLDPRARRALAPGRRPFHTLNPAMAELADGRVMAYGTMGGEGQPQTQAAVFTRHVTFGVPLAEAIARPRWLLGRTWGSSETNLRLEEGFSEALLDRLASAGHEIAQVPAYSDTMGHAGAVVLHPKGTLEAAHDPRSDGGAAGI